jgi:hypothetical protein
MVLLIRSNTKTFIKTLAYRQIVKIEVEAETAEEAQSIFEGSSDYKEMETDSYLDDILTDWEEIKD